MSATAEPQPEIRSGDPAHLETLAAIQRRVLWLAVRMVDFANRERAKADELKVGGHQASSASLVSLMTALYFASLRAEDRVSVKPHASPVLHAIEYLLGRLPRRYLTTLRELGGLQAYPSRTKDPYSCRTHQACLTRSIGSQSIRTRISGLMKVSWTTMSRASSKASLLFRPGKDWAYSSTGFDILGDVVAKVSGQNFEDYVQDHVLTPLGLEASSYLLSDVNPAALVAPHMYDEKGNAKTLDFFPYSRTHAPSGAFYSNVNDMARFAVANMNHGELNGTRVLPASAYDKMWAPQAASSWAQNFGPQVTSYGLGWWVGEFKGHRIIGNYGTEFGFQSHLGLFPDEGIAVIALVNLFDPEAG